MAFESLINGAYISLKTFRKTGEGVPTPVWFAPANGNLYVLTLVNSGKVKRIRNNSTVEVASCDMRGNLKDGASYIPAQAYLLPAGEQAHHANALLNRKYGLLKHLFDLSGWRKEKVYIEIRPMT